MTGGGVLPTFCGTCLPARYKVGVAASLSLNRAHRQHGSFVGSAAAVQEDRGAGGEGGERSSQEVAHPWSEGHRGCRLG